MTFHVQSLTAAGSLLLTLLILELIRRRKLQDELWIPLLVIALAPLVATLWIAPWAGLARWLGIIYEPALLLALGTGMSIAMFLYLAVVVSTLLERNLRVAQELAVLQVRLDDLSDAARPIHSPGSATSRDSRSGRPPRGRGSVDD